MEKLKIAVAGSGNIAWHLAATFFNSGHEVNLVISRNESKGRSIAKASAARWSPDPAHAAGASCLILAISDTAIADVASQLPDSFQPLVAHTSGSVNMDVLSRFSRHGVFYPLQSFTAGKPLDFRNVPVLTEGNTPEAQSLLMGLGESVSSRVIPASSAERLYLHLGAVFAANFTNALYGVAESLLRGHTSLPFDLLSPLIRETAAKAAELGPLAAQTGPAKRNDQAVIRKHLTLLEKNPELSELYANLTRLIRSQQNENL